MNQVKSKHCNPVAAIAAAILLLAGMLCFFSARWFVSVYGRIGFDSILYTLQASLGGVQSGLVIKYMLQALIPALGCTGLILFLLIRKPWQKHGKYESPASRRGNPLPISILLSAVLALFSAYDVELVDYLQDINSDSELFESSYADPHSVSITFPEKKRNLIYIMLESMETTYLSQAQGGAMEENLIPELQQLAEANLTFSHFDPTHNCGYYTSSGATWTIGSMVAQTAGIPLKTPTEDVNQYGAAGEDFLPGVTSITDILHDEGYYQALMVGSDATFGGRRQYFTQHGIDAIYDIYTARQDGIVPKGYFVWWGMEDLHLFEYAKQELSRIAEKDQPFAFTMLTVDTHHVGGYQCALCEDAISEETYDQSISCSSRQVKAFVEWIQKQEFYENTTIVIVGDHESMDNGYMARNVGENYQRRLYNCFINAAVTTPKLQHRMFCAEDLFPTTLAAMGCTISGDRLGLGVNLFSQTKTLTERLGFAKFNDLLAQSSDYYEENFYVRKDAA